MTTPGDRLARLLIVSALVGPVAKQAVAGAGFTLATCADLPHAAAAR